MAILDYIPLTETTELTGTSVNSRFTDVAATINALPAEAVAPRCFGDVHLPSTVVEKGTGVTHQWVTGSHTYKETVLGSGVYAVVSSNGDAGGGTTATLTFSGTVTLANAGPIAGILVMADVNLQALSSTSSANANILAGFRIAYTANGGSSWTGITRTERHVSDRGIDGVADHAQHVDVSIRTLITVADNATIDGVRLETTVIDQLSAKTEILSTLRHCHITALVIRSELS